MINALKKIRPGLWMDLGKIEYMNCDPAPTTEETNVTCFIVHNGRGDVLSEDDGKLVEQALENFHAK